MIVYGDCVLFVLENQYETNQVLPKFNSFSVCQYVIDNF